MAQPSAAGAAVAKGREKGALNSVKNLVTGYSGVIGTNLLPDLVARRGERVVNLDRETYAGKLLDGALYRPHARAPLKPMLNTSKLPQALGSALPTWESGAEWPAAELLETLR